MTVVADSSPLQYLIQIGCDDLLPQVYERILLPRGVMQELSHPNAPVPVRTWITKLPKWVELHPSPAQITPDLEHLGLGEREAIQIAVDVQEIDIILLDDRQARVAAKRRGLRTTGTLAILLDAGGLQLVDPRIAYSRLVAETTFRTSASLEAMFFQRLP